ncbi:MAG: MFS transporter [Burkholderiales bacterium]
MNPPPPDARVVVTGAMFVLFLAALEQTVVATALPAMVADLGQFALGSWVITAYLLSSVCATPVAGKLSDMFGRARVLRACLALFVTGSLGCALAPHMEVLVAARVVQGLGGGGLMAMAQVIIADAVAPRDRGRYAGYFTLVWMSAAVAGPLFGGVLAQAGLWRWIFGVNLPLGAVAFVLSNRALARIPEARRPAHVDFIGIVLLCLAAVALLSTASSLLAIHNGNRTAVVVAVGAIVLIAAFVRRQRSAREPIIPPQFLRDRVIAPVLATGFLVSGSYLALTVVIPLYFQVGLGRNAAESGLLLLPTMLAGSAAAMLGGRYTKTHGRYRTPPLRSLPVAILAAVGLGFAMPTGNVPLVAVLSAVAAMGVGTSFPCTMVAAQSAAPPRDVGAASGAMTLSRALGGALVTGIAIATLLVLVQGSLPEGTALAGLEDLLQHPMSDAVHAIALAAFGKVAWLLAGVLAAGFVVFAVVEDRPLATSVPSARLRAQEKSGGEGARS